MMGAIDVHRPVMCDEVIKYLNPEPGETILDCTVGCGGHSEAILEAIRPGGRLIGIDRDKEVLAVASMRLQRFKKSYQLIHENFRNLNKVLTALNIDRVDGMLFDLGVSSYQLDCPERGFSIKSGAPLDMRMDRGGRISAFDLVNNLPQEEISRILKEFGQERWSHRIASRVVRERKKQAITTTQQLVDIVMQAIPAKRARTRIHPATRTFQAIRIAVNRELEALEETLSLAIFYLNPLARICVVSFHSLEDRIVKHQFRNLQKHGVLRVLTAKPLTPERGEISQNPRSRSAKLRAAEKT